METPIMAPLETMTNLLDPGPKLFSDFSSFNESKMEQESISSLSVEQGSIKSEQEVGKNGLSDSLEIGEGNIKNTLKEIINEIDSYAERDDVLKESSKVESMEVTNDGTTETKVSDFQAMEIVKANGKVSMQYYVKFVNIFVAFDVKKIQKHIFFQKFSKN